MSSAVNVTVDFTQGSNSILAPGGVNGGDPVVVDGQEKLTDGANVGRNSALLHLLRFHYPYRLKRHRMCRVERMGLQRGDGAQERGGQGRADRR